MRFIPDQQLQEKKGMNLSPMVDFLFLLIAVFAVLAVTRSSLYDTEIHLAKLRPIEEKTSTEKFASVRTVNISIDENGKCKWLTEGKEFFIDSPEQLGRYLLAERAAGKLPEDLNQTHVLLHIDREAKWDPIVKMVFSVREAGFGVHPVYEAITQKVD